MKKNVLKGFLLSICGILLLCSCTREEDYPEKIVGNWEVTEIKSYDSRNFEGECTIINSENGILEINGYRVCDKVMLSFDGEKVRGYVNGGVEDEGEYSVVGDVLSVSSGFYVDANWYAVIYGGYQIIIESMTDNKLVLKQDALPNNYGKSRSSIVSFKRI